MNTYSLDIVKDLQPPLAHSLKVKVRMIATCASELKRKSQTATQHRGIPTFEKTKKVNAQHESQQLLTTPISPEDNNSGEEQIWRDRLVAETLKFGWRSYTLYKRGKRMPWLPSQAKSYVIGIKMIYRSLELCTATTFLEA